MTKALYIALCAFFVSSYSSAMKKAEYDDPEVQAFFDEYDKESKEKQKQRKENKQVFHQKE